jgi:hypothetical protein
MPMDQFLAEYYGTKTASADQENLEKEASVDLFLKLAGEEGIDLQTLPDAQVQELYARWKTAAEQEPEPGQTAAHEKKESAEKEEREHVVEKAKEEHEEKKAYAEKVAEADFLGRVMAHSYVQEMRKIAGEKTAIAVTDEGHKLDKERAHGEAEHFGATAKALREYADKAPIRHHLLHGPLARPLASLAARNAEYREKSTRRARTPSTRSAGCSPPVGTRRRARPSTRSAWSRPSSSRSRAGSTPRRRRRRSLRFSPSACSATV